MKVYPEYKNGGLPWLTSIPKHWELHKLGAICKKLDRKVSSSDEILICSNNGTVFPRNENTLGLISDRDNVYQGVAVGDLLIHGMDTWHGAIAVSQYKGKCSKVVHVCNSSQNKSYISYFLQMLAIQNVYKAISNGVRGNTSDFRSWNKAKSILIAYPPTIEEQNVIVSYLDKKCIEIDALVSRRQAIIERLKELKQSIIAEAVTKGLNPDVPMKDSGVKWLGDIPTHWNIWKLRNIFHKTSIKNRPDLPLLSVVREQGVIIRNVESKEENHNFIPDDLSKYKVLQKGQFVINKMKAWQGSYAVSELTGIVSPAYFIYDVDYSGLLPSFFNLAIRSKPYVGFFNKASDGVRIGQWDLDETQMRDIPLFVPPLAEQAVIVSYLDKKCAKIDTLISRQEQIIGKLKELKTSTIAHVVTGKVDVRDTL